MLMTPFDMKGKHIPRSLRRVVMEIPRSGYDSELSRFNDHTICN